MRLLVVTQALDLDDPVLSAYHEWIVALAMQFEHLEVVCLKEGRHALPKNVQVHSLGKEKGNQHFFVYSFRFLVFAWNLRRNYDAVFVHMNQEYLLIAGWLWKLLQKPAYLWRNHYAGSWITDVAAAFCTKVFCTSKHSYTVKYAKTVLMPVGVDTTRFTQNVGVNRMPHSLLFFARIAPSKRLEIFIDALRILTEKGVVFTASVFGSALPKDESYYQDMKARVRDAGLRDTVSFHPGVPNQEAPFVFGSHEIFVNTSRSGMFDKMLFEAAASGTLVVAASDDWRVLAGESFAFDGEAASLASRLEQLFVLSEEERKEKSAQVYIKTVIPHSLTMLVARLKECIVGSAKSLA